MRITPEEVEETRQQLGIRHDEPIVFESPVDMLGVFEPPPFSAELLPPAVADFVEDQAELIGVDPAVIGMAAIATLAGAIDDRIRLQPKRFDPTWTESARLWVGIIGDPSAKKTPGINKALAPLQKAANKLREEHGKAMAQWCEATEALEKGEEAPPKPVQTRLTAGDTTTEKLAAILAETEPRGILIYRDELTGWLTSMDCYKNGGGKDRAAWLEAYNGGFLEVDRVQRGSTFVPNWSACVIGGIQPDVIHNYAETTNHDGMIQRFLLIHAKPAKLGVDRYYRKSANDDYRDLIQWLVDLKHAEGFTVTLSESAHVIRERFAAKLHKAVANLPHKGLSATLGKWEGTHARLMLIYHCCDCVAAKKHPVDVQVSEETALRAAALLWKVLLPHAIKFYEGCDSAGNDAKALAGLILAKGWSRFTVRRDLNQHMLAYRKMKDWQRDAMLERLEAFGWIAPEPGKVSDRGKPVAYEVNPAIHEKYAANAEAERERRAAVSEIMGEIRHVQR